MLSWGMRTLTHSDICFPQEVYYSTSRVHTGSLFSANLYSRSKRWGGSRHCEPPCSRCAVSAVCQGGREEGDGKRETHNLKWRWFHKKHPFIYFTTGFFILVFLSAHFLILLMLLFFCLIQGLIIVISFIFSWGAEFLTRLIFGSKAASGFNLRGLYYQKRMFQNVCLLLTTPSRARMQSVFCCLNERLLAHVFNKEQSESGERREERGRRKKS